jgi:hypothetical protein
MLLERDVEIINIFIKDFNEFKCIVLKPINSPGNYFEFKNCSSASKEVQQMKTLCLDENFMAVKNFINKAKNVNLLYSKDQEPIFINKMLFIHKITFYIGLCTKGFQKYLPSCNKNEHKIGSIVRNFCVTFNKNSFWKDFP